MRCLILIFYFCGSVIHAQQISPFNKLAPQTDSTGKYSFLVSGHWHGSSLNQSGFPAATILANIDNINNSGSAFILSAGDLFMDISANIPCYNKALFSKLTVPLFNAPGNHDITQNIYVENFGATWTSFTIKSECFILLNTEENDGSIKGDQLNFFKSALRSCKKEVKNIFICSHRPIWCESEDKLKDIFKDNTRSDFSNNFKSEILPLITEISKKKKVFWFSGSLGGNAPASFFYYKTNNITYIQSAVRDLPRDGLLKVSIDGGKVIFKTISLTGQQMPKLENCGLNIWKNPPAEQFNYRLVPLYVKQMLFHRYFWYGLLTAFIVVLILVLIRKRWKKRTWRKTNQ